MLLNISADVTATAVPRLVSSECPRLGRGGAATRLLGMSSVSAAAAPRLVSSE